MSEWDFLALILAFLIALTVHDFINIKVFQLFSAGIDDEDL